MMSMLLSSSVWGSVSDGNVTTCRLKYSPDPELLVLSVFSVVLLVCDVLFSFSSRDSELSSAEGLPWLAFVESVNKGNAVELDTGIFKSLNVGRVAVVVDG